MNRLTTRILICFLAASAAGAARGQSPATSASPPVTDTAGAQPAKPQTLSKQVGSDCYNRRRLAIRAVNLKYIALTQEAAAQFAKENNAARADDANTWAKNLAWANDANLKGVAPEVKDRLGELQAAYLKERVDAIVTADNASADQVEAATKQAIQAGDQASAVELAKQEDRIKQELRSVNAAAPVRPVIAAQPAAQPSPAAPPAASQAAAPSLPAGELVAQFKSARSEAVKTVNQKYARNAKMAAELFHDDGNQSRADEATAWAGRLDSTDDAENMKDLAPGMNDRLGSLQKDYINDRASVLLAVDRAWFQKVQAAQKATPPETDMKGATALLQIMDVMCKELGMAPPPRIAVARPAPRAVNPSYTPASQPASQADTSHPFGVTADKLPPGP
jgi:hypothetical protein